MAGALAIVGGFAALCWEFGARGAAAGAALALVLVLATWRPRR
jgi:hypothetical protein